MQQIDHIGVAVDDLEEAKQFLSGTLGLEFSRDLDLLDVTGVKAAFFRCGEVDIEVIWVADDDARRRRLGEQVSARIDHIAIQVESLQKTVTDLSSRGVRIIGTATDGTIPEPMCIDGTLNLWTDPATCDGVMYQLVEQG